MSIWLLPEGDLTPDQMRAVEMAPDRHRVILGVAGSGKTQVLVHRAAYLAKTYNIPPERFRVFVFTNVVKEYIRSGMQFLGFPDETVCTFDHWCRIFHEREISERLPRIETSKDELDFKQIRLAVLRRLKSVRPPKKYLDFILVDEGQDLSTQAFEIMTLAANHVTVFADPMQQIFEDGAGENEILQMMGLRRENAILLGAYRNSPYVAELAAHFIDSDIRKKQYLSTVAVRQTVKERPLCYIASNHDDAMDHLAEMVRLRTLRNERVGIIVSQTKRVYGIAKAMEERGIDIEMAIPHRKPGMPVTFDFNNDRVKIATYHSAKGLTFDSVLLPKITEEAFKTISREALRKRMLFVGITRATQWVYLNTVRGKESDTFYLLREAAAAGHLTIQDRRTTAGTSKKITQPYDDYDIPF